MKHVVIVAHPNPESFNLAMAHAYVAAAEAAGHAVLLRDLYRIGFDPRLKIEEDGETFEPAPDVRAERVRIADADVFALVYPLWLNSPPAMMKGYLERIFGMGFAYEPGAGGGAPLLSGKELVSISSSGAPLSWVRETGAWDALRAIFDHHFASVCGLSVVDHLHFGDIVPGITPAAVAACRAQVAAMVEARFGPGSAL